MNIIDFLNRLNDMNIDIRLVDGQLKINAPKGVLTSEYLEILRNHKSEIIELLSQLSETTDFISIYPAEEKEYYMLSSAQKRLFFIQQMAPGISAYNIPLVFHFDNNVNPERLQWVLMRLIERHESFRTSFGMVAETPVQFISKEVEFNTEILKLKGSQEEDSAEGFVRPFDLSKAPLLRARLIERRDGSFDLLLDVHHIITDGTSQEILKREFQMLLKGEEPAPVKLQYKDYCEWLYREKQDERIKKQEKYWMEMYEKELTVLDLPVDFPRPPVQSFEGKNVMFHFDEQQAGLIKLLARQYDSTPFMVFLALFNIFLFKLTGQEDMVTGTPIASRRHSHLEGIVGMFVNTIAIRTFPEGKKAFPEFMKEINETTVKVFENQEYPFEDLVDLIDVKRDSSRNPVFDVMFSFQNMAESNPTSVQQRGDDFYKELYIHQACNAKFDLMLTVSEIDNEYLMSFEYRSRLFKSQTIDRFISYFKQTLLSIMEKPTGNLYELGLLTEEEKKTIILGFNQSYEEYPEEKIITDFFEEQVQRTPDSIALTSPGGQMTFRELDNRAAHLATILRENGAGPDMMVGLMIDRSIELIIGIYGILKAGAAYIPIDPQYPEDRVRYMLTDSDSTLLVTTPGTGVSGSLAKETSAKVIYVTPESYSPLPVSIKSAAKPHNLFYVIYTSGSTGKPKGVMVNIRGFVNLMHWYIKEFQFDSNDCVLLIAPVSFDLSQKNLYASLFVGGVMCLAAPGLPEYNDLSHQIAKERVTVINCAPSVFYPLLEQDVETGFKNLKSLRHVFLGGEPILGDKLLPWQLSEGCKCEVVNTYGPTECTDIASSYRVTMKDLMEKRTIPIGRPVYNVQLYILDKYLQLLPVGVMGELCIGGTGVSYGYHKNPDLTKERFVASTYQDYFIAHELHGSSKVPKPFDNNLYLNASMIYKTGDLTRWIPDAEKPEIYNIEFLGRIDHQVKVRGLRIELGEIESQLSKHEQVKEAVVIFRDDEKNRSEKYICAYVIPNPGQTPVAQSLREHLGKNLPAYMIPAYFVLIDTLPLTPSGKVDKKALPAPDIGMDSEYIAPRDRIEERMVQTWKDILGIPDVPIGIHSNFFELGGHSLNAIRLSNALHKEFQVKISLQVIFQFPTVCELADIIRTNEITPFIEITPVSEQPYYELSYSQKRLWVLQKLNKDTQAFNMPERETLFEAVEESLVVSVLEKLASRHEALRTSFKEIDGRVVQVIAPEIQIPLLSIDLTSVPSDKAEERRIELFTEESRIRFDLEKPPLLRVKLIKCNEMEYDIVFNMHHLISDGWSMDVLKSEFIQFYRSLKDSTGYEPQALPVRYKDYAAWHNRLIEDEERMKGPLEFWRPQLEGQVPLLNLPYDFPPQENGTKHSSGYRTFIGPEVTEKLRILAQENNASLFMVMLAGIDAVLSRLRDQEDIVIAMPGAARQHESLKNIIGFFINTLVLRVHVDKEETFAAFLERVKADTVKMLEYQSYPLELICERLKVKYPQVSFFFNMLNTGIAARQELTDMEPIHIPSVQESKFEMALYISEYKNGIMIYCSYYNRLFTPQTIEGILALYMRFLQEIGDDPGKKLREYQGSTTKRKISRVKVES